MKRAPIVLTGTALGLVGVLSYHTASTPSSLASASAATAPSATAATTASGTSSGAATTAASTTTTTTTTSKTSTKATATTRSATGEDVNYQYGDIEVKVTMSGTKITKVSVVKLDVSDPHSESIDQMALPQLAQQATSAQSAKLDGVSGASYTSAAYEQSLQSALDKLA